MKEEYNKPTVDVLGELHDVTSASFFGSSSDWLLPYPAEDGDGGGSA